MVGTAVKETIVPAQIVSPGVALMETATAVVGKTVIVNVFAADGQPASVSVNVYTPELSVVAPVIVAFCKVEVKPSGPDQLYVTVAVVSGVAKR